MLRFVVAVIVGIGWFSIGGASTARANDHEICFSKNTDDYKREDYRSIAHAACSRIITSKRLSNKHLGEAYSARAYWNTGMKKYEAAMSDFSRALELDASNHETYDYRGDLWVLMGNDERALADYEQAVRVKPSYLAARFSRGRIYERRGEIDRAKAEYRMVLDSRATDRIGEWAQENATTRLKALAGKAP